MTKLPPNDPQEARDYFSRRLTFTLGPMDVHSLLEDGAEFTLIDVRAAEDYSREHIPGALNLPEGRWRSLAGLAKNKMNVIYCYSQHCHLGSRAAFQFAGAGYQVMEMEGGFKSWKESAFPTEGELPNEERKSA